MNIKVDIIVPVLNDLRVVDCIESIRQFDDLSATRILIMAGSSSKEFVEEVRRNLRDHDIISNDPDVGLFDALNKGLRLSDAPIIGWLGADDIYSSSLSCSEVLDNFGNNYEAVIYSTAYHRNGRVTRVLDSKFSRPSYMSWGFHNPHFSTFLIRELAVSRFFKLSEFAANQFADIEYFLDILPNSKMKIVPSIGTYMAEGGAGSGSIKAVWINSTHRYNLFKNKYGVIRGLCSVNVNLAWKIYEKVRRKIFLQRVA